MLATASSLRESAPSHYYYPEFWFSTTPILILLAVVTLGFLVAAFLHIPKIAPRVGKALIIVSSVNSLILLGALGFFTGHYEQDDLPVELTSELRQMNPGDTLIRDEITLKRLEGTQKNTLELTIDDSKGESKTFRPDKSYDYNILVMFSGVVAVLVLFFFLSKLLKVVELFHIRREHYQLREKMSRGAITYKQAFLYFENDFPNIFQGVSEKGESYGPDDEAKDANEGFYSFYSVEDALAHHQKGNVFLEVMPSGRVEIFTEGLKASHQRVLQVLIPKCSYCETAESAFWNISQVNKLSNTSVCEDCSSSFRRDSLIPLEVIEEKFRTGGYDIPVESLLPGNEKGSFIPTAI